MLRDSKCVCIKFLLTCVGSVDLMHWKCKVPGKAGSMWEKGLYPVDLVFTDNYPSKPPTCRFPQGFFHPNGKWIAQSQLALLNGYGPCDTWFARMTVYPAGVVCLSIVNEKGWRPAISIKQVRLFVLNGTLLELNACDERHSEGGHHKLNALVADFGGHTRFANGSQQQ